MSTAIRRPGTGKERLGIGSNGGSHEWDGGWGGESHKPLPPAAAPMGMAFALAGIAMLFVAFTSAYVVRYGLDPGWRSIRMPWALPVNTAVLLASSITLELARWTLRSKRPSSAGTLRWLYLTLAFGALFLTGQFVAWRQLSSAGVYLSTNPHASFFYLLTGLHALHLLGGILALAYVSVEFRRHAIVALADGPVRPGASAISGPLYRTLDVMALYWHFMDVLWVYVFVLLFAWR